MLAEEPMSIHSDNFASAANALFEQFGESGWTYTPAGGASRSIDVIVERGPMTDATVGQALTFTLKLRPTDVDPASVNRGGDRLAGPEYLGGASRPWQIAEWPVVRGGLLVLRVR